MVKQLYIASLFTTLLAFTLSVAPAAADCCGPSSTCNDGTAGTPCCGYGKCNIFCCNCDGGCRKHFQSEAFDFEALHVDRGHESIQCRSKFTHADANSDGKMDFAEWVISTLDASELEPLASRWLKFDTESKGYMTEAEAFERTAA